MPASHLCAKLVSCPLGASFLALLPLPLSLTSPLLLCSAAAHVVRESLKWRAKDGEAVDALHEAAPQLVAIYRQLRGQPDGVPGVGWGLCYWLTRKARVVAACVVG
jgi:hypothetical protein